MKSILFVLTLITIVLLTGCSRKEVFKPKNVKGDWKTAGRLTASIEQISQTSALLKNGHVITKEGDKTVKIPTKNRLINVSGGWVISQNEHNALELLPDSGNGGITVLDLNKTVAAASIQDDTVAILFSNNEIALYSLQAKKMTFKESSSAPIAVDARIANPYFLKDLALFLGLDGKIVIVNTTDKQVLRSIIVGSEEYFNNITYLNVIENNMVAATGNGVLALSQKEEREKYEVRDIAYTAEGIWLTTKQGEVVALSPTLQFIKKQKFPFAHFVGISVQNDRVYVVEKEGYMIALTKNLLSYDIFDIDMKHDPVFVGNDRFYFDDRYISIK